MVERHGTRRRCLICRQYCLLYQSFLSYLPCFPLSIFYARHRSGIS